MIKKKPKEKPQLMIIHGGMTFKNNNDYLDYLKNRKIRIESKNLWAVNYLNKKLGKKFQMIRPRMPLQDNAKYKDWKIYFERFIPYLKKNVILIGNSLGAIFLAKYLSENKFLKKLGAVYIIAAPFDNSLPDEDLVGGFKLGKDLSLIEKNCKNTIFMFSKNDDCVPVEHAEKYRKKLPNVKIIVYDHINGHFEIEKFPEIIKMVKRDFKKIRKKIK